jgi:ceramide glucosyltransferase
VKDSLAEDFLLGRYYAEQGKKVVLSATPIRNVNVDMPVERSLSRHARWLKMRAVIHIPGFIVEPFANPVALTLLAWISSGFDRELAVVLAALLVAKMGLESLAVRAIRGTPVAMRHLVFAPLKDVLMLGVWVYAMFSRSIEWRGIRFRIGPDSQLLPDEGALPVRVLRRLLSA